MPTCPQFFNWQGILDGNLGIQFDKSVQRMGSSQRDKIEGELNLLIFGHYLCSITTQTSILPVAKSSQDQGRARREVYLVASRTLHLRAAIATIIDI